MNRDDVLKYYDRFVAVVEKLPGGIQKPILAELQPIREMFLEQRPARIVLLGGANSLTAPALLHLLSGGDIETGPTNSGWRSYRIAERGTVEILDARSGVPETFVDAGLAGDLPDLAILLGGVEESPESVDISKAEVRMEKIHGLAGRKIPLIGLGRGEDSEGTLLGLSALLHERGELVPVAVYAIDGKEKSQVPDAIAALLPMPAKLEFARFSMAKAAQVEIAESLLKSFSALCGLIGVQPIPLADLPVLTAIQSTMVSLIVYVSGRQVSPKLLAEFAAAVGINVGAGFLFREAARAVVKVVPIWGNAVSGVVAGAGTYAIGRSAIAYFIEERIALKALKKFKKDVPKLK